MGDMDLGGPDVGDMKLGGPESEGEPSYVPTSPAESARGSPKASEHGGEMQAGIMALPEPLRGRWRSADLSTLLCFKTWRKCCPGEEDAGAAGLRGGARKI